MAVNSSTTVFDTAGKAFSQEWLDLLTTDDAGYTLAIDPAAAGETTTELTLTYKSPRFWKLSFDTVSRPDFNVGNSILLNLTSPIPSDANVPTGIEAILSTFGITSDFRPAGGLASNILSHLDSGMLQLDTSSSARNAMWFTPGHTCRLDTLLTFKIAQDATNSILEGIAGEIQSEMNINVLSALNDLTICLQRTCYAVEFMTAGGTTSSWDVTTTFRLTLGLPALGLMFWVTLDPGEVAISVTQDTRTTVSDAALWQKMSDLGGSSPATSSVQPALGTLFSTVQLVKFAAGKALDNDTWWQVTAIIQWGRSDTGSTKKPLQVYLSYDSDSDTFSGGLVLASFYASADDKLLPTYALGMDVDPPPNITPPVSWDLTQISHEAESLPIGFPTSIALATLSYSLDTESLSVAAKLVSPTTAPNQPFVPAPFQWTELDVEIFKSQSDFTCSAAAYFRLTRAGYQPADLAIMVSYDSALSEWILLGSAQNLSCGLLVGFFDPNFSGPLESMLGNLNIVSLQLTYTHTGGVASSFLFTGTITIVDLELRLFYQYASSAATQTAASRNLTPGVDPPAVKADPGGTNWKFECDLFATGTKATIGTVVGSIAQEAAGLLPSFIADIQIPSATGRSPVTLEVAKPTSGLLMFALRIAISNVSFTFIQLSSGGKDTKTGQDLPTKRILRFSVGQMPVIGGIPLIGQLPQPFDSLIYMWVNDTGGITQAEVEALNANILTAEDKLDYKRSVPDKVKPEEKATNIVIQPYHHFMVIHNKEVSVDHVFGASGTPQPTITPPMVLISPSTRVQAGKTSKAAVARVSDSPPDPTSNPPAKGSLTFTFGPLSISAITLQYKEQGLSKILSLTMDAIFTMGPISFGLLGFGFGLPLDAIKLNDLSSLPGKIVPELQGLAVSFNQPPLLVAGGFEHQFVGGNEIYMGGIGISFPPYTFVGVGEYEILNGFKSVFIYCKLDGPIITLEFATIEGVRIGFGFNSLVRSPTIDQLTTFPFIDDDGTSGAGNDPMKILDSLCKSPLDLPWVTPKLDSFWFAAGVKATAFDILKITAVAMFAFRDSGLIISIFADAIATMPPNAPANDPGALILYVEIGMLAEMNFVDGYFLVEAALAPTSFILVPQCHVYGGFALAYWFPPSDFSTANHAGDWVFSVGGYHRRYQPPSWYPVPTRLGMSFSIGILSITGESYFAITPKAAMGGAMIHVSLSFGPIKAWLDATFDALVNFHPLHYIVDFSISVGVEFDIDVLFIHIHISASVGADLHIEGPDFGGIAHVDFYLFGFSVDFGSQNPPPAALNLHKFWEMVHQPGPTGASPGINDLHPLQSQLTYDAHEKDQQGKNLPAKVTTEDGAAHKFILEDGNCPMPKEGSTDSTDPTSTGIGAPWYVKGGTFRFRITSDFAISQLQVAGAGPSGDPANFAISLSATTGDICSQPMRISAPADPNADPPIKSTLSVTIREKEGDQSIIGGWQNVAFVVKPVPSAVWGSYVRANDPLFSGTPDTLLNGDNASTPASMGVMLSAPAPELAPSFIPAFNATDAAKLSIEDGRIDPKHPTPWYLADPEPTQTQYLAAPPTAEQQQLGEVVARWTALNQLKQEELNNQRTDQLTQEFEDVTKESGVQIDPQKWWAMMDEIDTEMQELNTLKLNTNEQMWDSMITTWTHTADTKNILVSDPDVGAIAVCTSLFGWTKRPQQAVPDTDWQITCNTPTKLIKDLKSSYLALPGLAYIDPALSPSGRHGHG